MQGSGDSSRAVINISGGTKKNNASNSTSYAAGIEMYQFVNVYGDAEVIGNKASDKDTNIYLRSNCNINVDPAFTGHIGDRVGSAAAGDVIGNATESGSGPLSFFVESQMRCAWR